MSNYAQQPDGSWRPAVPLPLYTQWFFGLRKRYVCECGEAFKRESDYFKHYRSLHHSRRVSS